MVFSSLMFLFVFLPMTLVLYYLVPKPLKNPVLILCSLIFYAWETPQYLVLMIFSVVFNYCAGLELDDLHQRGKPKAAKWVMIAGLLQIQRIFGGKPQPHPWRCPDCRQGGAASGDFLLYLPGAQLRF